MTGARHNRNRAVRRLRAVTLIESVLFVSVALGLIVGGLAVYQQSSLSERSSSQMRMLGSIVAETRSLYDQKLNLPSLASTADPMFLSAVVDDVLIRADAVAATYVDASAPPNRLGWASPIRHGWKGAMNVLAVRRDGSVPHMLVYIEDIPSEVCVRLSSMTATGKTGFVEQMTEIVFQVPNGSGGFNIAKLPSVTYPLPITPNDLALPAHCGPAGGRVNVIYWVPLD
ncbi:MAG: hypothetical protein LW703_01040 [Rhodobacter sp.]|nr:hypothetical protein [Rhodobacter sp.]